MSGAAVDVAGQLKKRVEAFTVNLPLIAALRNPGMRDRHWTKLSDLVGFPVRADANFSVSRALQLNLHTKLQPLEEVRGEEWTFEIANT